MRAAPTLRLSAAIGIGLMLLAIAACGTERDAPLEVFAASSLTNAFTEIAEAWESANPDIEVRVNFAGSSALREQLRDGAKAEVFASSNESIVAELVGDGTIAGDPAVMASNELVLAVPTGNAGQVQTLDDLRDEALFLGVCTSGVPCGDLAEQLLAATNLSVAPDTEEPDVRSLARRLAEGELDAALIYATDAAADATTISVIPTDVAMPSTRYPIATIAADNPRAQAFVDFVLSEPGQAILLSWGFQPA